MKKDKKKEKDIKKEVKKAMIATTATTSLLVNNAYDSPLEIIDDTYADDVMELYEKDEKNPYKNKMRYLLSKIPQPYRSILLLPLWCIGWLLMLVIRPLWTNVLSGIASDLTHWFILLIIVLAGIIITSIFMFPALPLKKIFNKKVIIITASILAILFIVDKILIINDTEYARYSQTVKLVGSLLTIIILVIYNYFKNRKVKIVAFDDHYAFRNE